MKKISQQELQFCIHVAAVYKADQTLNILRAKNLPANDGRPGSGFTNGSTVPAMRIDTITPISPITRTHNCIEQMDSFGEQARKIINLTQNIWGVHSGSSHKIKNCAASAKQPIQVTQTNNCAGHLGDISDWALKMIGGRVAATGEIA